MDSPWPDLFHVEGVLLSRLKGVSMDKIETVLATVLDRVTPNTAERKKIGALAKKLEKRVRSAAERSKVDVKVRVEGSVAKDTWLSGEADVDVFMRVS